MADNYLTALQDADVKKQLLTQAQERVKDYQWALAHPRPGDDREAILAAKAEVEAEVETRRAESAAADQALVEAGGQAQTEPERTVKTPDATNLPSASDADTAEKYADPNNTPSKTQAEMLAEQEEGFESDEDAEPDSNGPNRKGKLPAGAERTAKEPATAKWAGVNDLRVILKVHKDYLTGKASALASIGGVLFPYTPQISYESQATYGSTNPLHSNYTQYFYKSSAVTPIQINGKFTVQNEKDGIMWLATQHLLRALTKMHFGADSDAYRGSPPPVCRLNGFGDYQLANVPVAVQSFKFELPDSVDYISISKPASGFATTLVPTMSTLSLTLIPMYSRKEIQNYGVRKFISGELTGKGFL